MGDGVALVDRYSVGDAVAAVHHCARSSRTGEERQYWLAREIEGHYIEGVKEKGSYFIPSFFASVRRLTDHDSLAFKSSLELVVDHFSENVFQLVEVGDLPIHHGC